MRPSPPDRKYSGQPLDPIEHKIMDMLSRGLTAVEAAKKLRLNENTVHNRVTMIRSKLDSETTLQAMYLWAMDGPRYHRLVRRNVDRLPTRHTAAQGHSGTR